MKTKEDYKRAQVVVKKVIDDWDPYALLKGGSPDDEFAPEITKIISHLPRIKTENDAINTISEVMSEAFEPEQFTPDKCTDVGRLLFVHCKEKRLIE
jgi:hypothetical protein